MPISELDANSPEIILMTAACIVDLYEELIKSKNNLSKEEYNKELMHIKKSASRILDNSRINDVVIPKPNRLILYEIIKL